MVLSLSVPNTILYLYGPGKDDSHMLPCKILFKIYCQLSSIQYIRQLSPLVFNKSPAKPVLILISHRAPYKNLRNPSDVGIKRNDVVCGGGAVQKLKDFLP